ncbi:MAG TPA: polysaccharide biosynthesis/export family protein [Terriglobales bacterium]|jgi:polysaccharide export outer membrane protein|nr:polysaccharide biosynthesis/export family protein [Terriglobales bacterium]
MENGSRGGQRRARYNGSGLEQTMSIGAGKIRRQIAIFGVCVLITGCLAAQTDSIKNPNNTKSEAQTSSVDPGAAPTVARAHDDTYIIGDDDVLAINVWKEPEVSRTVPVRSDGKISLPLAGEVQASGETPRQLEKELASKLQSFISEPEVTVIVTEVKSQKFNILGQVSKPGSYPLTNSSTVLDAIATAGGFRDFAKQKSIYILRQNPNGGESRLPFNYKDVIKGKNSAQNIKLQPRDTIVVP